MIVSYLPGHSIWVADPLKARIISKSMNETYRNGTHKL